MIKIFKELNLKNTFLWRYVTLPALLDMLLNKRIYFSSPLSYKDPWEGHVSEKQRLRWLKGFWDEKASPLDRLIVKAQFDCMKRNVFICCWHKSKTESEAMWNKYQENHSIAIAVRSENVKKLFPSIADIMNNLYTEDSGQLLYRLNEVRYINETRNPIIFEECEVFFYKRISFNYENEVRSLIFNRRKNDADLLNAFKETKGNPDLLETYFERKEVLDGMYLPINPNKFISKILIHPQAKNWVVETIKEALKKLGLNKSVEKSKLFIAPN